MKKIMVIVVLSACFTVAPTKQSHAIVWVVVQAAIKKVIRAMDLAIQRLQNKTIWLQNAQKALENTMSKLKLDEITDWVEKQRILYKDYFDELQKVKSIIAYYQRIKAVTQKQLQMVDAYKTAFALFKKDKHFTPDEIIFMAEFYTVILNESVKNLDQLFLAINSFSTSMTDAKRIEIINAAADKMDQNFTNLIQFNTQNKLLSINRAKDQADIDLTKALYGLK